MERFAFLVTIDAAIRAIQELITDDNRGAAVSVITSYNHLRSRLSIGLDTKRKKEESEVRLKALDAEEYFIEKLRTSGQADRETLLLAEEHIHRMRLAVTNRLQYRRWFIWTFFKRSVYALLRYFVPKNQEHLKNQRAKGKKMIRLKVNMAKAAIHYLRDHMKHENEQIYLGIIGEYNDLIMKCKLARKGADSAEYFRILRELQIKAFQAERDEIQNLYEEGDITVDVIRKIRQQINIREAYWMEETSMHSH
jgi:hypothetical protein